MEHINYGHHWRLPWPTGANANNLYVPRYDLRSRSIVANQRTLSPTARAWKEDVMDIVALDKPPFLFERLGLVVGIAPPDRRRRDLDNIVKLLQDAIAGALRFDDSRVVEVHLYRLEPRKGGHIIAGIRPAREEIV